MFFFSWWERLFRSSLVFVTCLSDVGLLPLLPFIFSGKKGLFDGSCGFIFKSWIGVLQNLCWTVLCVLFLAGNHSSIFFVVYNPLQILISTKKMWQSLVLGVWKLITSTILVKSLAWEVEFSFSTTRPSQKAPPQCESSHLVYLA